MAITEYTTGLPYTFTPLPWDAIAATGMAMQQRGDENMANLDALGALKEQQKVLRGSLGYNGDRTKAQINPYDKDQKYVDEFFNEIEKDTDALIEKYGNDMANPQIKYGIRNIQNKINKDLTTGGLARVNRNYETEMQRQKDWAEKGKIWSKEPGKAHDFLMRGNQFIEKGDWLENAPIGEYTNRIKIMGDALKDIPDTILSEYMSPEGMYIRKRISSGFGLGKDYERFKNVTNAILQGNTELQESVNLEVQQKLYQQGLTGDEIIKTSDGKEITSGQKLYYETVSNLMDYAQGFRHQDVEASLTANDPWKWQYDIKKKEELEKPLAPNVKILPFTKVINTVNPRENTDKLHSANLTSYLYSLPTEEERAKAMGITDIYNAWKNYEAVKNASKTRKLSDNEENLLNVYDKVFVVGGENMDKLNKYVFNTALVNRNKDEIQKVNQIKDEYSSYFNKQKNAYIKKGYNESFSEYYAKRDVLELYNSEETAKIQGNASVSYASTADDGKTNIENIMHDAPGKSFYAYSSKYGIVDKSEKVAISKDNPVTQVGLIEYGPYFDEKAGVVMTLEDGSEVMAPAESLNKATGDLVKFIGMVNEDYNSHKDIARKPKSLPDNSGLSYQVQDDNTIIVGQLKDQDLQSSGNFENLGRSQWTGDYYMVFKDIEDFNQYQKAIFFKQINPKAKGYKEQVN